LSKKVSKTQSVAGGAVFGALALIFSLLQVGVPFLPLPYLVFQFAEIPVVLSTLLFGPLGGAISAFEYWAMLQTLGQNAALFGPEAAFLAVGSSVLGIYIAKRLLSLTGSKPGVWLFASACLGTASLVRVPLLTAVNWWIFNFLAPGFIPVAAGMAARFLSIPSGDAGLGLVLVFTGIFNIIQLCISLLPAFALAELILSKWLTNTPERYWLGTQVRLGKPKLEQRLTD
jgi:hypothetical protein